MDRLSGGDGSDTYLINSSEDSIFEQANAPHQDTDSVQSSITFTLPDNVENLLLTGSLDIDGTGNIANNRIDGNDGANQLFGAESDDILNGNGGDDILSGGDNSDTLNGGEGNDTAVYEGIDANYSVSFDKDSHTWTVVDNSNGDTDLLSDIEILHFADTERDITSSLIPSLSMNDVDLREGNSGNKNAVFTLTLSEAAAQTVSVDYTTLDDTAQEGLDYTAISGTVSFAAGETRKTVSVPIIGDKAVEINETLRLILSNPNGITLSDSEALATLTNDDQPLISIAGTTLSEGNSGSSDATVTVTLSAAFDKAVSVDYATVDGSARAGSDYTAKTGSLTFNAGETSKTISIGVLGDTAVEANETLRVLLKNPGNAFLNNKASTATVTLSNDDAVIPSIAITAAKTVAETHSGNTNAELTVTLSEATTQTVTVNYDTINGTATAGSDYTLTTNTLTFAAGETSKTITIPVLGDTTVEGNETLSVQLSTPINATLAAVNTAIVTISNDDAVIPSIAITAAKTVAETNSGNTNAEVTVTLSEATTQAVTVNYATADSSATADSDYTSATNTLTFAAGETSKTISIPVLGDTTVESDETFNVVLSTPINATLSTAGTAVVTISNDDAVIPTIAIAATKTQAEGNSGNTNAEITVTLSEATTNVVTVKYATTNGTAKANDDYTLTTNTLTFAAGETSKTISIPLLGDTKVESDETFNVVLSTPTNATLSTASTAVVTLSNDDLPSLSITATKTLAEANNSSSNATVTVTLSEAATQAVTVNYATTNGTATAGSDYTAVIGSLTFAVGETSKTLSVSVLGDTTVESDETFNVVLSAPTNAALSSASTAVVTISNDDVAGVQLFPVDARSYDFELPLTDAADSLDGSPLNEKILGLGGNDKLSGKDGNDYLDGGAGDDTLSGDGSNDYLLGGDGADTIYGGDGQDSIDGGNGSNKLYGNADDDLIVSGTGSDTLDGGTGSDTLNGGDGGDSIDGGDGDDSIEGGGGADTIQGGAGANTMNGGLGNDTISDSNSTGGSVVHGGDGGDRLTVYEKSDVYGDAGDDSITVNHYFGGESGLVYGGDGNDSISLGAPALVVDGGDGDDSIGGSNYSDSIAGGNGNDTIDDDYGNDALQGGLGDDWLGYNADHTAANGSGNDSLLGGDGNDHLHGGIGSSSEEKDWLEGDLGTDVMSGGGGADSFVFNLNDSGVGSGIRDIIGDFETSNGEIIDLSRLSTNPLSYLGMTAFNGTAETVRFSIDATNNQTLIQLDMNGDKTADMEIELTGIKILAADDFLL